MRVGRAIHEIGQIDDSAYITDINAGRAVVETLIQQRLFARDRAIVFENTLHVSDIETWLAYRQERSSRSFLDPAVIERARYHLSREEGEILVVEGAYAACLTRL